MTAAHPLSIAEIFDRAVTLVVQRWRVLLVLALLAALPDTVLRAFNGGRELTGAAEFALSLAAGVILGALLFAALTHAIADRAAPSTVRGLLAAARADYWRSLRSIVLVYAAFAVLLGVALLVLGIAYGAGVRLGGGLVAGALAAAVAAVPVVAAAVVLFVLFGVAYPTTVLEGVGARRGVALAWSRIRSAGFGRAWLLGAAALAVTVVPIVAFDALNRFAADAGAPWVGVIEPFGAMVVAATYGTAITVVAAVDYRNRSEGTDLTAELEQAPPA